MRVSSNLAWAAVQQAVAPATSARRIHRSDTQASCDFDVLLSAASVVPSSGARVGEVMRDYDLHNISFGGMERLGRALVDAGALPEGKLLDFIPLRPGGIRIDGKAVAFPPDVPVDMIQRQRDIIASQVSAGVEQRFVDQATAVLKLYEDLIAARTDAPGSYKAIANAG